jgi:hypothetical protein
MSINIPKTETDALLQMQSTQVAAPSMRAKFTIESINSTEYGDQVKFVAKYDCKNSPEDNSYSKYTPSADASLSITNPALIGKFKPGQQFYVDFTPIS